MHSHLASIPRLPLRLLALAGLGLSSWLLILKATGSISYLVGCGADSGCANVLGSRWSQWFLVPVSALSLVLYGGLLALTFRPLRAPLLAIGICLGGGALWFTGLQLLVLRQICPWCMTAHAIGLASAALTVRSAVVGDGGCGSHLKPILGGTAALALLVMGQWFGPVPNTHLESTATLPKAIDQNRSEPVHSRGEGRKVVLAGKSYNVETLPHLGDPAAPHVLVKYFDYACDSCRELHADLNEAMKVFPDKLCIIVLPCPIDRSCNPSVPSHISDHQHACSLARIALACWRQQPGAFPQIHEALFARPLRGPKPALSAVRYFLDRDLAEGALQDPWIDEVLAADSEDYKRLNVTNNGLTNYLMPKLLVRDTRMLHGVTKDRQTLLSALAREFQLGSP
jgi:uncharacterized membrane protein/protein-disulfide isomerase